MVLLHYRGEIVSTGVQTNAPNDATYVTLSTNSSLSAERTLAGGSGITLTDAGANGAATISIANDAIDSQHYAATSIDNEHLADNAVDSDELAAGSVDTAHIANSQITNALMADDAIGVAELSATGTASSSTFLRGDNAWAAGGGAVSWEGGNTTEDSSTSTSVSDLCDVTSLTIPAGTPIRVWTAARYGAGGGDNASIGLTINGTAMRTPVNPAVASQGWEANGNDDMDGVWILDIGPRVTNYTKGLLGFANRHPASGVGAAGAMHGVNAQAALPTGEIQSIVHTGIVASGATIATDEMHVYSWAVS